MTKTRERWPGNDGAVQGNQVMDDRRMDQSRKLDQRERARALIGADARALTGADARAFMLSHPSAARVAGLLALEIPPTHERACAQTQTRERENTQTWRSPVSLASAMIFAILLTLGLHIASRSGSLAAPAFVSPERFEARSEESAMRKNPKSFAVAAAAALSVSLTATAQDAVQWRVEDGGNGHWYQLKTEPSTWLNGRKFALANGGDLSSLETASEFNWAKTQFLSSREYVNLGGLQSAGAASPSAGWAWLTGGPIALNGTFNDNPCNCGTPIEDGQQNYLHSAGFGGLVGDCNSGPLAGCGQDGCDWQQAFLIEWSADCNSDGIVDFGQILAGELNDENGNNIPDCCEAGIACNCSADVTGNGNVDAADLAAVLSAWGGAPSGKENADINGDGSIDAADLAGVLSAWGPCP